MRSSPSLAVLRLTTYLPTFTFEPVEPQDAGFDFTPGQYLTVKVDPNGDGLTAPRHYTTTSPPGKNYLECTTKKVAGGVVSTYMHEKLKVGDTVKLTPPYGVFTLDQELPTGVLVSAGIGVTPMINFARALGEKTALVVHVDKTEAAHAFKAEFKPYKTLFKYTDGGTRPSVASVAKETIEAAGTNHCFYICGPPAWMNEMQAELLTLGAKKVMCEVFGSQLATGCPFAASAPEADFDDRTADYAGDKRYSADGGTDENDDGVVGEAPPNATPLTVAEMRKENNLSDLFK